MILEKGAGGCGLDRRNGTERRGSRENDLQAREAPTVWGGAEPICCCFGASSLLIALTKANGVLRFYE